jgi:hypothetical protein
MLHLVLSAIPSIVNLINSDNKSNDTAKLIKDVANSLNIEPKKDKILAHLEANPESVSKIQEYEMRAKRLLNEDRKSARDMNVALQNSDSWLSKNTGSIIAMVTMVLCFVLFGSVLFGKVELSEANIGMLIGGAIGFVTQILSFYFGSAESKEVQSLSSA